jgi:acetyl-CoA synthetase (ADP-forming)
MTGHPDCLSLEEMNEMKECEKIIEEALKEKRAALQIDEAQRICALHQIPTPKYHVAKSVDEAVEKASEIGYPITLKIISPQIIHKSDVGGVILNVENEMELRTQYEKLTTDIRNKDPSAMIAGVMIEEMIPPSIEVVVGGIVDNQFGPAVMFGVGGIFTEVYDDVVFRVAPIDRIDALNMIRGLRGSKILEGTRGEPPADINSIVDVLTRVSDLILEHRSISQLDLNPVIVFPKGVYAVDSRMIIASTKGGV